MVYTEVRIVKGRKQYYRVYTYRKKGKVVHSAKYLGSDLTKKLLKRREKKVDLLLRHPLQSLLSNHEIALLDKIKKEHQRKHPATFENRYEAFTAEFTYDSTGIEGNTLTLPETAAVLFEGASPTKSLREVYEVINHKKAFDYLLGYKGDVTKAFLCKLQKTVTENTLRPEAKNQAGKYRTVPVFIRGGRITPPPASEVPKEMRSLLAWYGKNKKKLHPAIVATYFHAALEAIHPFVDGNGRAGRLALNLMLHKQGYPMITIQRTQKVRYWDILGKAQADGNFRPLVELLIERLKDSEKSI